jgi:hypothetical protein
MKRRGKMKKRYKLCRHAGPGLNRHCGDCARTCALKLGANGTCRLTGEAQTCASYEVKVKAQFRKRLPVVEVDHPSDLESGVVGDSGDMLPSLTVNDGGPRGGTAPELSD